jgi:hypothetical protein
VAGSRSLEDETASPARQRGAEERAVAPGGEEMEIHLRDEAPWGQGGHTEGGAAEAGPAAVEGRKRAVGAPEGVETLRVALADLGGCMNRLAHDDEDAAAARVLVPGDAHGGRQIRRSVPAGIGERPHRAAEDDRLVALEGEVEEVGGLLQRVRPVPPGYTLYRIDEGEGDIWVYDLKRGGPYDLWTLSLGDRGRPGSPKPFL